MKPQGITPEEYLQQEDTATDRHEYFNGQIYLMAGGTHNHEMIAGNFFAAFTNTPVAKNARPMAAT